MWHRYPSIQKCKVRTLANLQKEGFQSISPTYPANSTVDSIVSRIIPMSTFVGGFPFASSGYNDGRGYYFAKDSNGGLVILDTWERGNDRTNSSFVIMGVAGIGKSTVVKHIMLSEYMKGTKILCIDPESEYKDMCRNLNGSWLNAGGGKNGRSNLLQIRPAPRDDDDETDKLYTDEGNGMSDMALHMKTLEIEFSLYLPSLTDMQKAILKQTIIELYNQFGIFWETDIRQLKATDFPILSDLHALLEKKAAANKENPVYRDLAMLLYDAAAGSDSFLWNGHTTLEANSRFICLDSPTVVAAAITSRKAKNSLPTHILLENVPGLAPTSLLLLEQLRTIDRKRLRGYIGRISKEKMLEVDAALAISIGIGYPNESPMV